MKPPVLRFGVSDGRLLAHCPTQGPDLRQQWDLAEGVVLKVTPCPATPTYPTPRSGNIPPVLPSSEKPSLNTRDPCLEFTCSGQSN